MLTRRLGIVIASVLLAGALMVVMQRGGDSDHSANVGLVAGEGDGPESLTPLPDGGGSFSDLAGEAAVDVTNPWAGYVAIRPCAEVMDIAGVDPGRAEALLAPFSSRGTTVCSFQTPDITLVGPDKLEVKGTREGDFELQVLFVPSDLKVDSSGLDEILGSGGALLTIDIAPALREEQPTESDAKNPGGGWIVASSGVPNGPSVLSRVKDDRYLLRWFEQSASGLDLRLNVFVDTEIDGLLERLGVTLNPNPD